MGNEEWMTTLAEDVRNIPLINLAIPGSHNSMTYGIESGASAAPDANTCTRRLNYILPCFVRRWAKTQSATIEEQLELGVRYFDLRTCQKDDKFYYTHGLYAMEIFEPLLQIKQFLEMHKQEVVVLDFQHFYAMTITHHAQLHTQLLLLFKSLLYTPLDGPLSTCTLNKCSSLGKQLLLIYRRCPVQLPKEFWPSYTWPTPWPNAASLKQLQAFLQDALLSRRASQGYVTQCVLTPTGRYITLRCLSSLRRTAKKVDKRLEPWIANQSPGPFSDKDTPKVNVFIADYVNLKNGEFCNMIIELNNKLDCKLNAKKETESLE